MKTIRLLAIVAVLVAAGLTSWLIFHRSGGVEAFGHEWSKPAPDFRLTNQDSQPFQLSSLRGKVTLLTFGFTHCPNICPTTLANLAAIQRSLTPSEQARVRVVFVSVDP